MTFIFEWRCAGGCFGWIVIGDPLRGQRQISTSQITQLLCVYAVVCYLRCVCSLLCAYRKYWLKKDEYYILTVTVKTHQHLDSFTREDL